MLNLDNKVRDNTNFEIQPITNRYVLMPRGGKVIGMTIFSYRNYGDVNIIVISRGFYGKRLFINIR